MTAPAACHPSGYPRVDRGLAMLHADLVAARSAVRTEQGGVQRVPGRSRAAQADLLICLEAYTTALAERRLPIPGSLRDELRLRRLLTASVR